MNNIPEGFKLLSVELIDLLYRSLNGGDNQLSGMEHGQAFRDLKLIKDTPEAPAPAASERSNKDYAIEHAEYMAKSADGVLAKFQAYGLALLAVDEGGDDGEGELFEAIDTARSDLQESLVDLRSMVYEFRKRSAKT